MGNTPEHHGDTDLTTVEISSAKQPDGTPPPSAMTPASNKLRMKIVLGPNTVRPQIRLPWLTSKVPSEALLADVKTALFSIPTATIKPII